jgi:hypothetical protein
MNKLLDLVEYHKWKCREVTNNGLFFYASFGAAEIDKRYIFPPDSKKKIGIPEDINSFYDQKNKAGAYERLLDLTIMSLCSDIEYFFKEFLGLLIPDEIKDEHSSFFHNMKKITKKMEETAFFDFKDNKKDIQNIFECFQVRHISTHNMGYVDADFSKKIKITFNVGEKYIVDEKTYQRFYQSYTAILDNISQSLEKLKAN